MTERRIFRGHIDRAKSSSLRTGGRQEVLIVMVDPQEASALKAALPADLHRSQSIPIAFVVGGPGEDLAVPEAEPAPAPAGPSPEAVALLREATAVFGTILGDLREDLARTNRQVDLIAKTSAVIESKLP